MTSSSAVVYIQLIMFFVSVTHHSHLIDTHTLMFCCFKANYDMKTHFPEMCFLNFLKFTAVLTDSYGTSFVFPVPLCENKESIHIVISPRAIQLTTVSIFGKSLARFAELNYGNTKTVSIPCTSEEQPAPFVRIPEGE